jgi:hypothetical protein
MRGIASAQVSAGAKTCVLVGPLDAGSEIDLSGYRSVLWFADRKAPLPLGLRIDPAALTIEPTETNPDRVATALERIIQRDALHLPSIFLSECAAQDPAGRFLPVVEAIVAKCEAHSRARLTRQQVGFQWQSHLLANLHAYAQHRVPRAWAGALAGVPALVCGSGPSLDASGEKLRQFADRGVVLAADSALGALARWGVTADFAVTIDATKTPAKCLAPDCRPPGRLLAATISPPTWRETMGDEHVYFVSGNQLSEDWLASLGLSKTALTVQGNCGITAVELAIYLGCSPICLFGMDNAVDGKGSGRLHQQHFDTKLLGDDRLHRDANYPKVPGNYQDEIGTPFLREWRLLDRHCAKLMPGRVWNVIDRGARLSNTTLIHPDRFSIEAGAVNKTESLTRLAAGEKMADADWEKLAASIREIANGMKPTITAAQSALRAGDCARVQRSLAAMFRDQAAAALMGSYALKVLPHLLQPTEATAELWTELVKECATLVETAGRLK